MHAHTAGRKRREAARPPRWRSPLRLGEAIPVPYSPVEMPSLSLPHPEQSARLAAARPASIPAGPQRDARGAAVWRKVPACPGEGSYK